MRAFFSTTVANNGNKLTCGRGALQRTCVGIRKAPLRISASLDEGMPAANRANNTYSAVPPNRLDLDDDLYNQAQSMYPEFDRDTMPGTELQDDDHFDETQDDVARMFERPQMEITAKPGSIEEKIQRVLYSQPLRKALAPDEELLELEFYLREGSGNRYNLVRGIAARARLEEERQLHNPTPVGEFTKPLARAVCAMASEMHSYGGQLSDLQVAYPAQMFKRQPAKPPLLTDADEAGIAK